LILSLISPPAFKIVLFLDKKSLLIKATMLINNRDVVTRLFSEFVDYSGAHPIDIHGFTPFFPGEK
jgi:hypothetical protein